MKNLFDIQCPECGGHSGLYMFDTSDPTPRDSIRLSVSEDETVATGRVEPGEWIFLGPYWDPEEEKQVTVFYAGLGGRLPVGIATWCASCGYEGAFETFKGDQARKARQSLAVLQALRLLYPDRFKG